MYNRMTESLDVSEIVAKGGIQRWFNCLSAFVLGALGDGSRAATAREQEHLNRCKACRKIVDELRGSNRARR